ncbi:MAG: hypothetical protein ACHQ4G_02835, partial [Opitutales bacterium]
VIARELREQGAALEVRDAGELAVRAVGLLRDAELRGRLAAAAQAWHRTNAGAVARTVQVIRAELAAQTSAGSAG